MQTDEFVRLTEDAVTSLLRSRYGYCEDGFDDGRRQRLRWPFPGTIELWVPDPNGDESMTEYILGKSLNLSPDGLGALLDEPLAEGQRLAVAIHEPEATMYGEVEICHCAEVDAGYHVGMRFIF